MPDRLEQFISELVESGILTVDEQRALIASDGGESPADSDDSRIARMAEQLVREGRVTEFQSSLLLAGRGRELRLENYLILEKLGEGGMGTVFKAVHLLMHRMVAVKTLRGLAADPHAIQRFQQEITALGRLNHPHVVRASHAGQDGGIWYLVMDFVPGVDLTWVSREFGALRTADACEIVRQTAAGLEYIDRQGLVHRDIKPSNLMLTADGTVRILDLGLARLREDKSDNGRADNRRLTAAGQILGTVDYIAPEQASGDANVDTRADIYSLGCTLFRLLTGHVPYREPRYAGKMERILAHVNDPFPDIRMDRPDLAPSLVAILQRMVAKHPSDRFLRPAELELALRPYCNGANLPALLGAGNQSVDATSPTILAPAPGPADPEIDTIAAVPSKTPQSLLGSFRSRWKVPRRELLPVSGVAILLVAVLVAVILSRKTAQQAPSETTGGQSAPPLNLGADEQHVVPTNVPVAVSDKEDISSENDETSRAADDRTPAEQQRFETALAIVLRLCETQPTADDPYKDFFTELAAIRAPRDMVALLEQLEGAAPQNANRRKFVSDKLAAFAQRWFQEGRSEGALRMCEAGLQFDPDSAPIYAHRGRHYQGRRDFAQAIADFDEAIRLDPQQPRAFYDRGLAWQAQQDIDKAIADFDETVRLDPKFALAFFNRAAAWHAKKELDKAIADYGEGIRIDPSNAIAFFNRGNARQAMNEHDAAIADYNEAVRLDPKYAFAFNNRGNAWLDKKDREKAIADYSEAIRLDPNYAAAYFNRASVWKATAEYDKALDDYNAGVRLEPKKASGFNSRGIVWAVRKDFDKAIADFGEAIRLDPQFTIAFSNRGSAWIDKQDYGRALADLDEAIRLDSACVTAFQNRGKAWRDQKAYDKAVADYNEAIRLTPQDSVLYFNRGLTWQAANEFEKAVADYSEAIRLDPKYTAALNNRGGIWFNRKEHDRALADFSEVIRLNPKDVIAFDNRGRVWQAKKEFDKAIADYSESIRLDPKFAKAFKSRGGAWFEKKDYDQALADFNEAIRLDSNDAIAFNNRGLSWQARKELDSAIADFDSALRLDPKNVAAWDNRGYTWFMKKNYGQALSDLDEAVRLDSKYLRAYFNRARVWRAKKEFDKAIADYDEYIRLNPKVDAAYMNRANVWFDKKDFDKAIADYDEAIRLNARHTTAYVARAQGYVEKREYAKAAADFEQALEIEASQYVQLKYATFLASCPQDSFRDGARAVVLARQALNLAGTDGDWRVHAALAAALAETGQFEEAISAQKKALADPSLDGEDSVDMQTRLGLYESGKPLRQPSNK